MSLVSGPICGVHRFYKRCMHAPTQQTVIFISRLEYSRRLLVVSSSRSYTMLDPVFSPRTTQFCITSFPRFEFSPLLFGGYSVPVMGTVFCFFIWCLDSFNEFVAKKKRKKKRKTHKREILTRIFQTHDSLFRTFFFMSSRDEKAEFYCISSWIRFCVPFSDVLFIPQSHNKTNYANLGKRGFLRERNGQKRQAGVVRLLERLLSSFNICYYQSFVYDARTLLYFRRDTLPSRYSTSCTWPLWWLYRSVIVLWYQMQVWVPLGLQPERFGGEGVSGRRHMVWNTHDMWQ